MGTSSSYSGPTGTNPLLPDWAPDPEDDQDQDQVEDNENTDEDGDPVEWKTPKRNLSNHINYGGNGSKNHISSAFSNFVKAGGGAKGSTTSSYAGRSAVRNLGNFLSSASTDYTQAFNNLNIDLEGKDKFEILSELTDSICDGNNTREDSIAREAAVEVLDDLFEDQNIDENNLDNFENIEDEELISIIENYVSKYIYKRFMQVLAERLENNTIDSDRIVEMEWEIRELVQAKTEGAFQHDSVKSIQWKTDQGELVATRIFKETYQIIEDWDED